ncbi:hypothetical protein VC279_20205 [Xanthomonas sp. WHRI 10064A]|uniref:hypothetical protein n=1 Tax=unclassified Xanthomonas TaxID=2643310 RepID=UPI002B224E58|nr:MULTISPECIES: hypothetical protein [unclassified Xanthomonas]MEA9589719.1 hypothetical protein [Xanthomonas sp. WHRI 10064B]MEA9616930.1 hypothetical protein [Xanthomonas sp. WHRI 10064A]
MKRKRLAWQGRRRRHYPTQQPPVCRQDRNDHQRQRHNPDASYSRNKVNGDFASVTKQNSTQAAVNAGVNRAKYKKNYCEGCTLMTTYKLEFRHRPKFSESIEKRHKNFLEKLSGLGKPWDLADAVEVPDIEDELVISVSLDKFLPKGIKGQVTYSLRNEKYLEDNAQFDDSLFFELSNAEIYYSDLLKIIFPAYVSAFGAYRAALHDWSVTRSDWPAVVAACDATKKDVNGRDGVFRISAVNYFDGELCLRAFGKSPQQIISCLKGHVEEASELAGGVLIVVSYTPLSTSEINTAGELLRKLLVGDLAG